MRSDCGASVLENLLLRTGQGDRQAAAELYDRTAPLLFALCIAGADGNEAAQGRLIDVFAKVWRYAPRYEGSGALDWICHQARC